MHCPKNFKICEGKRAIFITQIKGNQKELLHECRLNCIYGKPTYVPKEVPEKGHGRLEQREIRVFDAELGHLNKEWPWFKKIIEVTRIREVIGQKAPTKTVISMYRMEGFGMINLPNVYGITGTLKIKTTMFETKLYEKILQ